MNAEFIMETEEIKKNQTIIDDHAYYFITVLGDKNSSITESCCSVFAGYTTSSPRRELREAREINPIKVRDFLIKKGEPPFIINDYGDLIAFYLFGGHAIIEKSICEDFYPELVKPFEVLQLDPLGGYITPDKAPEKYLNRAPTKKDRMDILKRDNFKCRLCGRSPKDYVDIELHLHHIMPWSLGGLTTRNNLITLCKTCHDGLEPHFEKLLFSYNNEEFHKTEKNGYEEGIKMYQQAVLKELREIRK